MRIVWLIQWVQATTVPLTPNSYADITYIKKYQVIRTYTYSPTKIPLKTPISQPQWQSYSGALVRSVEMYELVSTSSLRVGTQESRNLARKALMPFVPL